MPNQQEIRIIKRVPAMVPDGHQIFINDDNGDVTIMLFQVYPTVGKNGEVDAEVINNIRLNFSQAKAFAETLNGIIEKHKKQ